MNHKVIREVDNVRIRIDRATKPMEIHDANFFDLIYTVYYNNYKRAAVAAFFYDAMIAEECKNFIQEEFVPGWNELLRRTAVKFV